MGFKDYFYIAVFAVLILLIAYDVILMAVNSQRIKKISRKVAVKKSIKLDVIWIILSAINAFVNFEQYRTAHRDTRLHLLAFVSWTICGTAHILVILLDRHIYITPEGLFYKSMIKIQPREKYRYRIDGDTLELYYKQNDTPAKYSIKGDKDELAVLLDENYVKYTGD
ncbi:MAG: hypothetical protein NC340_03490 [Ruminococcus flavefaciens]|nr:hypothetical protein [Ruminococcus flavefaciens]MCM1229618.1 hypothetical protein [Ruminococcus flavefaciens]